MTSKPQKDDEFMAFDISSFEMYVLVYAMTSLQQKIFGEIEKAVNAGKTPEEYIAESDIPARILLFILSKDSKDMMYRFAKTVEQSAAIGR